MADEGDGKKIVPRGVHGLYATIPRKHHLDGRSRFAKAVKSLRKNLEKDLGDDLSVMETLLLDRLIYKCIRLSSWEAASLKEDSTPSERDMREYVSLANSLRHDLATLGLQRREADIEDLHAYIARTYGAEKEIGE